MAAVDYIVTQQPGCNEDDCGNSVYGWVFLQDDDWSPSKGFLGPICQNCYEQKIDDYPYFITPNDPSVEWEMRDDGVMYPKDYTCMIFKRRMFSR